MNTGGSEEGLESGQKKGEKKGWGGRSQLDPGLASKLPQLTPKPRGDAGPL